LGSSVNDIVSPLRAFPVKSSLRGPPSRDYQPVSLSGESTRSIGRPVRLD
jgi:hypothetical protein